MGVSWIYHSVHMIILTAGEQRVYVYHIVDTVVIHVYTKLNGDFPDQIILIG